MGGKRGGGLGRVEKRAGTETRRGKDRQRRMSRCQDQVPKPKGKYKQEGQKTGRATGLLSRDLSLTSDFQVSSLPAQPDAALRQAPRLTPADPPQVLLWQEHGAQEPPLQPRLLGLQPGPSVSVLTVSRCDVQ